MIEKMITAYYTVSRTLGPMAYWIGYFIVVELAGANTMKIRLLL